MINQVEKFLKVNEILNSKNVIIVGFSGGYDSLCLLNILKELQKKYNFKLVAAHLNHNWRGKHSDEDEQRCKAFCEKEKIIFYTEKLAPNIAHTETVAREKRYEFFINTAKKFQADAILTAHTQSDNAETLLYRIVKGTGVKGLQGITPVRILNDILILRPILNFSRKDIEKFCNDRNLVPNNDSSNFDTKFARNFIRLKIIPELEKINPKLSLALNNLAEISISEQNIIDEYIAKITKKIKENDKFFIQKYIKLSVDVKKKIIYNFVTQIDLDYDSKKINEIYDFIEKTSKSPSGKTLSLTTNLWLFCNTEYFYLIKKGNASKNVSVKIKDLPQVKAEYCFNNDYMFKIEKISKAVKTYPKEYENFAYVDFKNITKDFEIRYRKQGDVIQPFGMNHAIKLKDFFINKKIPQHKKDKIVLLCNGSEIFWASGIGLSEKLRITDSSKKIHKISLKEKIK